MCVCMSRYEWGYACPREGREGGVNVAPFWKDVLLMECVCVSGSVCVCVYVCKKQEGLPPLLGVPFTTVSQCTLCYSVSVYSLLQYIEWLTTSRPTHKNRSRHTQESIMPHTLK